MKLKKLFMSCYYCNGRGIIPKKNIPCTICNGQGFVFKEGSAARIREVLKCK